VTRRKWYETRGPAWLPPLLALCFTALFVQFLFFRDGGGVRWLVVVGALVTAGAEWVITVVQWRLRRAGAQAR
jgi:prepilin signal peptidase PulO-like enzyme (type II secretory pathway)